VKPPRRILFLAEGQLGDLLLLTPALHAVKESFPTSFVCVFVLDRRTPLRSSSNPTMFDLPQESCPLATNKNVDELILVSRQFLRKMRGLARLRCEASLIRLLRSRKFDTVICTLPEDRFALWAFTSGARTRVGQKNQSLHWLLSLALNIEKSERGVLEYYLDLVRAFGATVHSTKTEYTISDKVEKWAKELLVQHNLSDEKIIGVHPGATGDYKIWDPNLFAELIEQLSRKARVVLLGGNLDEAIIAATRDFLRSEIVHLRAESIENLAALLRHCTLCISNDSGPRHLAVAVGTPSLALFRQHHDKEWGVYVEGNHVAIVKGKGRCPACPPDRCLDKIPEGEQFASHCMRMIRVEDVVAKAEEMMHRTVEE
jgi:ADP-heptose:LPS heptosyltransferase